MMQFSCKEVVEMYEDGLQGLRETLDMAADAAARGDVESNLRTLPLMWRKDVELYIFYLYDNDIDSDDFIEIGNWEPDLELRRRKITALRVWIASKKAAEPFIRDASEA